jgi:hypothetical protein
MLIQYSKSSASPNKAPEGVGHAEGSNSHKGQKALDARRPRPVTGMVQGGGTKIAWDRWQRAFLIVQSAPRELQAAIIWRKHSRRKSSSNSAVHLRSQHRKLTRLYSKSVTLSSRNSDNVPSSPKKAKLQFELKNSAATPKETGEIPSYLVMLKPFWVTYLSNLRRTGPRQQVLLSRSLGSTTTLIRLNRLTCPRISVPTVSSACDDESTTPSHLRWHQKPSNRSEPQVHSFQTGSLAHPPPRGLLRSM